MIETPLDRYARLDAEAEQRQAPYLPALRLDRYVPRQDQHYLHMSDVEWTNFMWRVRHQPYKPMTTTVTLNCPFCSAEIECEVTINEECDMPTECPECGRQLPDTMYDQAQEAALGKLYDQADRRPDR